MACLYPTYYPGDNKMDVIKSSENKVSIDGVSSSFQSSSQPLREADIGSKLSYAGTISISKHLNYTGPMIVVGRRERNGQFRVSNELLTELKCKPYPASDYETVKIDDRPCFMIIQII